jgi:hypothetical protein
MRKTVLALFLANILMMFASPTSAQTISAARSYFSCCGPFEAGVLATCSVYLTDDTGVLAGNSSQECRISICPLTDGAGRTIQLVSGPTFISTGVFNFSFNATASGCSGSAGISYNGAPVGGKTAFFTVRPGPAASNMGTSSCAVDSSNNVLCNITQQDAFGNAVKKCNVDTSGTIVCNDIL